jgi:rod shape-determining protein MreC
MKKINFKFLFFFAATIGLLVFLHSSGIIAPVEKVIQIGLNPVASRLQVFSGRLNIFYRDQTRKGDLSAQISVLEERVEKLTVENASLKKLEEENLKLRQYLRFFTDKEDLKKVLANVVARESSAGEGERGDFIIDRGRADGLYEGLVVIDEKGVLVGKIIAVEEKSSRVNLVNSSECKLAAAVLNGQRTIGITSGNLGLTINLDFVPQTAEIKVDDILVTSGLEPNIPLGLAIGKVIFVDKGTNEIWQKVSAEPIVDFDKVFIVAVILPK